MFRRTIPGCLTLWQASCSGQPRWCNLGSRRASTNIERLRRSTRSRFSGSMTGFNVDCPTRQVERLPLTNGGALRGAPSGGPCPKKESLNWVLGKGFPFVDSGGSTPGPSRLSGMGMGRGNWAPFGSPVGGKFVGDSCSFRRHRFVRWPGQTLHSPRGPGRCRPPSRNHWRFVFGGCALWLEVRS